VYKYQSDFQPQLENSRRDLGAGNGGGQLSVPTTAGFFQMLYFLQLTVILEIQPVLKILQISLDF
jgi:hypothetical protein